MQLILENPDFKFLSAFKKSEVFLVGGAVRDLILKRKNKDFDFVIIDKSAQEIETILKNYGKVEAVESRAFGVFKFMPKRSKKIIDIALPRIDRWTGLGYKDLKTQTGVSLEEDLSRRDFTINALALNLEGELIDKFDGISDLKNKIIKAVGDASERFMEDPSRILRSLRFACELNFTIEENTLLATKDLAQEIFKPLKNQESETRVAKEIMAGEFLKGFNANPSKMIGFLNELKILKDLLPEIEAMKRVEQPKNFHSEGDVFIHSILALEKLQELEDNLKNNPQFINSNVVLKPTSIYAKLGVLFHDLGKPLSFISAEESGDRIRFTGHDIKGAKILNKIFKRLPLSIFAKDDKLHVDKEKLAWLIKHHMVCVAIDPNTIRLSTLEKYFFNPDNRGSELLALSYADISATIPPSGKPDFTLFNRLIKKLNEVSVIIYEKQKEQALPHLLDGNEIMRILNLKPSKKVGEIKDEIRDLQLAGKLKSEEEAIVWLKANKF